MNDQHLKQILTQHAVQEIPDTMNLKFSILNQVKAEQKKKPLIHSQVRRIAASAVAVVALGTTAYALAHDYLWPDQGMAVVQALSDYSTPEFHSDVWPDQGMAVVQEENLVTEINETHEIPRGWSFQKINVTLDYAYADINRIAVAYRVTGEVNPNNTDIVLYTNATLADDQGRRYRWLAEATEAVYMPPETIYGPHEEGKNEPFSYKNTAYFDASELEAAEGNLNLTLKVEIAMTNADQRELDPYGMYGVGETTFDFQVPFRPGRTIDIGQTVTASSQEITLQHITIAPSLTGVDICGDPVAWDADPEQGNFWLRWDAIVSLNVQKERLFSARPMGVSSDIFDNACLEIQIPEALSERTGWWMLTIHELRNPETGEVLTGPWTYTFTVSD